MEERKKEQEAGSAQNDPVEYTNDPSGGHVVNEPAGANRPDADNSNRQGGNQEQAKPSDDASGNKDAGQNI